jgi:hypothetical protein
MLLVALALPAASMAEEAIPPGNSAVNQYTESLPTPTGHTDTDKDGKRIHRSPGKALGDRNAERLEAHGPDGRAAARVAAETAPGTGVQPATEDDEAIAAPPAGSGNGKSKGRGQPDGPADAGKAVLASAQVDEPDGSSGIGAALGEATGVSSTGQLGWLLPLLVLATALWALAYAMRQRRRVG